MKKSNFLSFVLISWLGLMVLAIINAVIREVFYTTFLNDLQAHQLSTVTLILIIVLYTVAIFKIIKPDFSDRDSLSMGVIWMITTIVFEFVAGHYVFGNSWDALFADYEILKGKIWILIPVTTLVSPYLIERFLSYKAK